MADEEQQKRFFSFSPFWTKQQKQSKSFCVFRQIKANHFSLVDANITCFWKNLKVVLFPRWDAKQFSLLEEIKTSMTLSLPWKSLSAFRESLRKAMHLFVGKKHKLLRVWVFCFVVTTFCCGLFKNDSTSSLTTSQSIPGSDSASTFMGLRFPIPKAIPTRCDFRFPKPSSVPGANGRLSLWLSFETEFRTRIRF